MQIIEHYVAYRWTDGVAIGVVVMFLMVMVSALKLFMTRTVDGVSKRVFDALTYVFSKEQPLLAKENRENIMRHPFKFSLNIIDLLIRCGLTVFLISMALSGLSFALKHEPKLFPLILSVFLGLHLINFLLKFPIVVISFNGEDEKEKTQAKINRRDQLVFINEKVLTVATGLLIYGSIFVDLVGNLILKLI